MVVFHHNEIKKIKVDKLGKELRLRGLYHRGLKAELIKWLNEAFEDKVPSVNEVTTLVCSSVWIENTNGSSLITS